MREAQKDKTLCLQQQTLEDNAKLILDAGKNVESLLVSELDTLLAWHRVTKTKGSKKVDKLQQWKDIVATGQQPPQFSWWMDDDEQKLAPLMSDEVDMVDTYYGREQALHERELEATMYCMSREKREEFRRKLDEIERGMRRHLFLHCPQRRQRKEKKDPLNNDPFNIK